MRFITAKFNSQCHETGKKIVKGESILYDPSLKKAYCKASKKYTEVNEDTGEHIQDPGEQYFDNFCQQNNI